MNFQLRESIGVDDKRTAVVKCPIVVPLSLFAGKRVQFLAPSIIIRVINYQFGRATRRRTTTGSGGRRRVGERRKKVANCLQGEAKGCQGEEGEGGKGICTSVASLGLIKQRHSLRLHLFSINLRMIKKFPPINDE